MVGIVQQDGLQPQEVAYQRGVEHRAVLAVAVRVVERLVGEEGFLVTELVAIRHVLEGSLHEMQQDIGRLHLRLAGNGLAQLGVQGLAQPFAHRGFVVNHHVALRIVAVEVHQVLVDHRLDTYLAIGRGEGAVLFGHCQ